MTIVLETSNLLTFSRITEEVEQIKYLGIILTNEVKLDAENDVRVSKASMAFGCLNKWLVSTFNQIYY